jgi:carboxyl-terminal processing protease
MQDQQELNIPSESPKPPRRKNNYLGILLAIMLAGGAFFSGLQAGNLIDSTETQKASLFSFFSTPETKADEVADLDQFWKVWKLLDEKFIAASSTSTLTSEDKINGAIQGLVDTYGDPYTVFLPPVENASFSEDISGNFSGIGMEVGLRDGVVTVISPLPNTPAMRAGLTPGDLIIKIDGISTEGMSIDNAVKMIRGEKGTEVILSAYREGDSEIKDIKVIRDTIDIPTIETEKIGDIFVIRLYSFNALAEVKMQEALREYTKSGAKSIILDMRGNPGGYLQSAVSIASYFLPAGKVVVREHYGDNNEEKLYRSQGRTLREFTPEKMVVLIDGGSASASEILAGALREHDVATLIGTDSFGKGSVQELVQLPDGSSLKVTVARWLTPDGISISEKGLHPDIIIKRTPEQRLEEIDPQQDAAIRYIKGEVVKSEVEVETPAEVQ